MQRGSAFSRQGNRKWAERHGCNHFKHQKLRHLLKCALSDPVFGQRVEPGLGRKLAEVGQFCCETRKAGSLYTTYYHIDF